jgi:predicted nucleic acid-binding protein
VIVVDTNIIACMTFEAPESEAVSALHRHDPEWSVPLLWKSEFLNIVALYQQKKLLTYPESLEALEYAEKLVGIHEYRISPPTVIELLMNSTCSSYDCEFVALAQKLDVKLLTYDKTILLQFPTTAVRPEDYLATNS